MHLHRHEDGERVSAAANVGLPWNQERVDMDVRHEGGEIRKMAAFLSIRFLLKPRNDLGDSCGHTF
jgi:hypothetical protein